MKLLQLPIFYILACIGGGIAVFAFSPYEQWWIAYLSVFILLWGVTNPIKKIALTSAFLWGISFFLIGINWINISINQFGGTPLVFGYLLVFLLSAYLACYPLLFGWIITKFQIQSGVIFACVWTLTEYLRAHLFTGFPWLELGYSQINSPFKGIAPLFGVQGISFFMIWSCGLVVTILRSIQQKRKKLIWISQSALLLILLLIAALTEKAIFVKTDKTKMPQIITLIQGNIEQQIKWDPNFLVYSLDRYEQLIKPHLGKSNLIILPESSLPALENNLIPYISGLADFAKESGSTIMLGSVFRNEQNDNIYNSVLVLDPNKQNPLVNPQRYLKHHLVPFGEYVPLSNLLRPLGAIFNLPFSGMTAGKYLQSGLKANDIVLTPAICYEIAFGEQIRENLTKKSHFILTLSNDAWFGQSIGPWQHLQIAQMRALELGKPVIRATNTGVTAFIDTNGEIIAQAPQFKATTLTAKIYPVVGRTPYSVFGNYPLYILIVLFTLFHLVTTWLKYKILLVSQAKLDEK
ncbi:apolipoprotein N-acyltransferase [Mergibacter septicus]|uniref:apolipoprotein N-acyltransferase n=1 Tax=Mergibacter septicus TaxID=221402 RepID=UPI0021C2E7FE|nr:apolipoprotein N-acyltransferase [Mergibacter septicus]WMR95572.1 apolipoprotein N-acyltransferase [Mergibacter septicus]